MPKVILDAGHGGNDFGGIYNRRNEKDDNLRLALAVGNILEYRGVDVVYTRTGDTFISPLDRVKLANNENADLYVTLHRGFAPSPNEFSGVRAFVRSNDGVQYDTAVNILNNLEELGFKNNGADINEEMTVLKNTNLPALVLNTGFVNSDSDNELYDSKFNYIAEAIADGILQTLEKQKENQNPSPSATETGSNMIYHYIRRHSRPVMLRESQVSNKKYKVILDAGHGGNDPGAIYLGRKEKDDNLNMTYAVGSILEKNDIDVAYTRETDKYISPINRLKTAQDSNGDLLVSIHRMSGSTANCSPGIDFFINDINKKFTKATADSIINKVKNIGFRSYGMQENLSDILIKNLTIPSMIVNLGFIDCENDNMLYDEHFDELAQDIANGIIETLGLQKNSQTPNITAVLSKNSIYRRDDNIKVILDAGHGGFDSGSVYGERAEKNDNIKLALAVGQILKKNGINVSFTRKMDQSMLPLERVELANAEGGDLLVSIHRMSGAHMDIHSCAEFFVNEQGDLGEVAALVIGESLNKIGFHNYGVYTVPEVTILKQATIPAVMLMMGFIDSYKDNILFDERFHDIAQAIADGIMKTLGL